LKRFFHQKTGGNRGDGNQGDRSLDYEFLIKGPVPLISRLEQVLWGIQQAPITNIGGVSHFLGKEIRSSMGAG